VREFAIIGFTLEESICSVQVINAFHRIAFLEVAGVF
jgi:hypothetical protein